MIEREQRTPLVCSQSVCYGCFLLFALYNVISMNNKQFQMLFIFVSMKFPVHSVVVSVHGMHVAIIFWLPSKILQLKSNLSGSYQYSGGNDTTVLLLHTAYLCFIFYYTRFSTFTLILMLPGDVFDIWIMMLMLNFCSFSVSFSFFLLGSCCLSPSFTVPIFPIHGIIESLFTSLL